MQPCVCVLAKAASSSLLLSMAANPKRVKDDLSELFYLFIVFKLASRKKHVSVLSVNAPLHPTTYSETWPHVMSQRAMKLLPGECPHSG